MPLDGICMQAVAEELRAAWLERWVGETLTVLFEEEKEGLWRGHAPITRRSLPRARDYTML